MDKKPWWKSRTIWFNVIVGAATTIAQSNGIDLGALAAVIIPAVNAVNVALRAVTVKGVS